MRILGKDFPESKKAADPVQTTWVSDYTRGGFQKIVEEYSHYWVGLDNCEVISVNRVGRMPAIGLVPKPSPRSASGSILAPNAVVF
jgi:hypothetical protein